MTVSEKQQFEGWDKVVLEQITTPSKNQWKPGNADCPYVGLEHINEASLTLNSIGDSAQVGSNKFRFDVGDILFGKLRPYFRKVVRVDFQGICSTDIWVFRAKDGYDQNFLFYLLANPVFIDKATKASTGTRMPRADWNFLKKTLWKAPSLQEQKRIANVLSSLDDKIELLRKQNETLEAIAQTIFKEWFVNFNFPDKNGKPYRDNGGKMIDSELGEIPEGWGVGTYSNVVEVSTGKGLKKEFLSEKGQYLVLGANGKIGRTDEYLLDADLILTGRVGTLGTVNISYNKVWVSDNVLISRAKKSHYFHFAYLTLLRFNFESLNRGSTQPLITQTDIKSVEVIIPDEDSLHLFSRATESLFNKIRSNTNQVATLEKLRDTLLPKLMSGQVRVKGGKSNA